MLVQKWWRQNFVSGKNIFWSSLITKFRGGKNFEFPHCPFEGPADIHHIIQPKWPVPFSRKIQRTMQEFKNFSSLVFSNKSRSKYIFYRDMFCLSFLSQHSGCEFDLHQACLKNQHIKNLKKKSTKSEYVKSRPQTMPKG